VKVTIYGTIDGQHETLGEIALKGAVISVAVNPACTNTEHAYRMLTKIASEPAGDVSPDRPSEFLRALPKAYSGSYIRAEYDSDKTTKSVKKYSEDEPRDESGKWTSGGPGAGVSHTQADFLTHAREHGGKIVRKPGGFWHAEGAKMNTKGVPEKWVSVQTVRALERKGQIARTNEFPEEWRDSRRVVENWKSPTPEEFIAARNKNPRGDFFSHLEPGDLEGHKLIMNKNGSAGAAVAPDGDIQNVFRNPDAPKGSGSAALHEAVRQGGRMLDAYDYETPGKPGLPDVYRKAGFVETGRMKFNPAYRPQWPAERQPDVVFMAHVGGDQSASPKATNYYAPHEWDKAKADSAAAAKPPVQKALSGYEAESEKIKNNKKVWGEKTHRFLAADWAHPNGHPRCVRCGDEEPEDGLCMPGLKKWERMLDAWTAKFTDEFTASTQQAGSGRIESQGASMSKSNWIEQFHSKCISKSERCAVAWPACPVQKYITHSGSTWTVHAESGKVLGTHSNEADAKAQLAAIEAHKHGTSKDVAWPVTPSMPGYGKLPLAGEKAPNAKQVMPTPAPAMMKALQAAFAEFTHVTKIVVKAEEVMCETIETDRVFKISYGVGSQIFRVEKSAVENAFVAVPLAFYTKRENAPVPIAKSEKQRYTLGVVYAPGERDYHGDTMTPEELEKSAWAFAQKDGLTGRVGIQHQSGTDGAGKVVESYIYRGPEWKIKDTSGRDQVIKPGSWMLGTVWDTDAWTKIERGALTGYSLQGVARKFANGEEV
jgi:hypothetical protein